MDIIESDQEELDQDDEIQNEFRKRPYRGGNQENIKFKKLDIGIKLYQPKQVNHLSSQITEVNHKTEVNAHQIEGNANKIEKLKEDNEKKIEKLKEDNANEIKNLKEEMLLKMTKYQEELRKIQVENNDLKAEKENMKGRISTLEDRGLCKTCFTEQIDCWLMPCQHWVLCLGCYHSLTDKKCPFCRKDLECVAPFYGR